MRERMVSSPLHLQRIWDDVFDSANENSSDCVYRAFLWMGFSGMSAEDTSTNFLGRQNGRDPLRATIRPRIARKLSDAEARNEERPPSEQLNLNYDISFDRIYLSGVFYRAYEAERAGTLPVFTEQARRKMERKKAKAADSDRQPYRETMYNSKHKVLSRITRELSADYAAWKKAFST